VNTIRVWRTKKDDTEYFYLTEYDLYDYTASYYLTRAEETLPKDNSYYSYIVSDYIGAVDDISEDTPEVPITNSTGRYYYKVCKDGNLSEDYVSVDISGTDGRQVILENIAAPHIDFTSVVSGLRVSQIDCPDPTDDKWYISIDGDVSQDTEAGIPVTVTPRRLSTGTVTPCRTCYESVDIPTDKDTINYFDTEYIYSATTKAALEFNLSKAVSGDDNGLKAMPVPDSITVNKITFTKPESTMTATNNGDGNLEFGREYKYIVVFYDEVGLYSNLSEITAVTVNNPNGSQILLSGIPTSPDRGVGRKIYRTSNPFNPTKYYYELTDIQDNTTTTFIDNLSTESIYGPLSFITPSNPVEGSYTFRFAWAYTYTHWVYNSYYDIYILQRSAERGFSPEDAQVYSEDDPIVFIEFPNLDENYRYSLLDIEVGVAEPTQTSTYGLGDIPPYLDTNEVVLQLEEGGDLEPNTTYKYAISFTNFIQDSITGRPRLDTYAGNPCYVGEVTTTDTARSVRLKNLHKVHMRWLDDTRDRGAPGIVRSNSGWGIYDLDASWHGALLYRTTAATPNNLKYVAGWARDTSNLDISPYYDDAFGKLESYEYMDVTSDDSLGSELPVTLLDLHPYMYINRGKKRGHTDSATSRNYPTTTLGSTPPVPKALYGYLAVPYYRDIDGSEPVRFFDDLSRYEQFRYTSRRFKTVTVTDSNAYTVSLSSIESSLRYYADGVAIYRSIFGRDPSNPENYRLVDTIDYRDEVGGLLHGLYTFYTAGERPTVTSEIDRQVSLLIDPVTYDERIPKPGTTLSGTFNYGMTFVTELGDETELIDITTAFQTYELASTSTDIVDGSLDPDFGNVWITANHFYDLYRMLLQTNRRFVAKRIYRYHIEDGIPPVKKYKLLAELDMNVDTYTDTATNSSIAANDALETAVTLPASAYTYQDNKNSEDITEAVALPYLSLLESDKKHYEISANSEQAPYKYVGMLLGHTLPVYTCDPYYIQYPEEIPVSYTASATSATYHREPVTIPTSTGSWYERDIRRIISQTAWFWNPDYSARYLGPTFPQHWEAWKTAYAEYGIGLWGHYQGGEYQYCSYAKLVDRVKEDGFWPSNSLVIAGYNYKSDSGNLASTEDLVLAGAPSVDASTCCPCYGTFTYKVSVDGGVNWSDVVETDLSNQYFDGGVTAGGYVYYSGHFGTTIYVADDTVSSVSGYYGGSKTFTSSGGGLWVYSPNDDIRIQLLSWAPANGSNLCPGVITLG